MEEPIRTTVRNAYSLTILTKLVDVGFAGIIFTVLPIEQVGLLSFAMAVSLFFAMFIDVGVGSVLLREFSRKTLTIRQGLFASIIVRIPAIVASGVVLYVVGHQLFPDEATSKTVALVCATQILVLAERFCHTYLKANAQQTLANILLSLEAILRLVSALVLWIFIASPSAFVLLLMLMVGHLGLLIVTILLTARNFPQENIGTQRESYSCLVRHVFPACMFFAALTALTVVQNRLDWLLISNFVSKAELANYSIANRIYEIFMMLIGVGVTTSYPWFCRDKGSQNNMALKVIKRIEICTGVTLALALAQVCPILIEALWPGKYNLGEELIRFMLPLAAPSSIILVLYYSAITMKTEGSLLKITAVVTLMQAVADVALIPRYGAWGAVVGMAILATSTLGAYLIFFQRNELWPRKELQLMVQFLLVMLSIFGGTIYLSVAPLPAAALLLICGLLTGYKLLLCDVERTWLTKRLVRLVTPGGGIIS